MSKANDRQVGGTHYKIGDGGEEHWDRQFRLYGPGYFIGCITKYVERYPKKHGLQDLRKAQHFIEKLIELEEAAQARAEEVHGLTVKEFQDWAANRKANAIALDMGTAHNHTGWIGFTYEGGNAEHDYFRCKQCHVHFNAPIHGNPNEHHRCKESNGISITQT